MKHTIKEKMELYTSSTKGKLEDLKVVLSDTSKNYSVTEEISKSGYFWTVLHYASHYGHYDTLLYLIDYLSDNPDKFEIFNMQTTEGKTPLFCAVLSGDIKKVEDKQRIIKLWFDTNCIDLSLRKQSGEDLLQLAKKNKLYDFIVEYCLRED
jgi:ankyrin repeat protein